MDTERLRKLRTDAKKSQKDLATFLGITRQGYGNYENGVTEPDHSTLNKLADYFNVTGDYILGRTKNPDKEESNLSFYGGPNDWTEEEFKAADAFIKEVRAARQKALNKANKEKDQI